MPAMPRNILGGSGLLSVDMSATANIGAPIMATTANPSAEITIGLSAVLENDRPNGLFAGVCRQRMLMNAE
jgi:hypothetical protein